ncbi:MAG: hypothetical protein C5B49_04280 [Bdellovibrio sp.]|nr:MAG: hypothetical protein C5B49_04280 [Bdellovibrio sp.]
MDKKDELIILIAKARRGDEAAVAKVVELGKDRLYRYCLMLTRRRESAEDLCQETFLRALQKLNQLSEPGAFYGWLCQLAKNIYIDQLRLSSSKETPTSAVVPEAPAREPFVGEITGESDTGILVRTILSHFDPEDRHLLLLVDMEGHSYLEASEIMKVSENAVRSRLHRIRQEFLKRYKGGETN